MVYSLDFRKRVVEHYREWEKYNTDSRAISSRKGNYL